MDAARRPDAVFGLQSRTAASEEEERAAARRRILDMWAGEVNGLFEIFGRLSFWGVDCDDAAEEATRRHGELTTEGFVPDRAYMREMAAFVETTKAWAMCEWVARFMDIEAVRECGEFSSFLDAVDTNRAAYLAKLSAAEEKRRAWMAVTGGELARRRPEG